ncbi:MAG: adenylosuccinate synthetase, partial [Bacteroidales bacterium]|nr:adenylosuccinate synthetase [Bacteroidales bacterium]
RCGWLDLVALKYAVMLNGLTDIIITKADVLNDFDKLKVAVAYKINGKEVDYVPFEMNDEIEPVYVEFDGWKQDISKCQNEDDLPKPLKDYLKFIAKETGVRISYLSVGPDRVQTLKVNIE